MEKIHAWFYDRWLDLKSPSKVIKSTPKPKEKVCLQKIGQDCLKGCWGCIIDPKNVYLLSSK